MNINTITAEDLRRMPDKEGLILQGCGGDLTEWVDGINEMLTHAGILFRCLPGLCKTEIRAGTQTPEAAKPTMICPQLSLKSP